MNRMVDFTPEIQEAITSQEVIIPIKYISKIEQLKSKPLSEAMYALVHEITKRMNSGNLDKVISLIHRIPLEYSLYEGVTMEERSICNGMYHELLQDYDRLFDDFLPSEVRKRKDQILKKTPE